MRKVVLMSETSASGDKWWAEQTPAFQKAYIQNHPGSKYAKKAGSPAKPASAPAKPAAPAKAPKVLKVTEVPAPKAVKPVETPVATKKGAEVKFKDTDGKKPAAAPAEKKVVKTPAAKAPVAPGPAKKEKVQPAAKRPSWPDAGPKKNYKDEPKPAMPVKKAPKVKAPTEEKVAVPAAKPAKKKPYVNPGVEALKKYRETHKKVAAVPTKEEILKRQEQRTSQLKQVRARITKMKADGADEAKLAKYVDREKVLVGKLKGYKKLLK